MLYSIFSTAMATIRLTLVLVSLHSSMSLFFFYERDHAEEVRLCVRNGYEQIQS